MQVTLRTKPISKDRQTLFLDIYPPVPHPETGKLTRKVYLGIYLYDKPKNDIEKEHNKSTKKLAENIKAKRQLEIQDNNYGFLKIQTGNNDFLAYFKQLADNYKEKAKGDKTSWISVYNYLNKFTNGNCLMRDITELFILNFKEYLLNVKVSEITKKKLANNTAVGYFNIFKQVIKLASQNNLLEKDFGINIKTIKKVETKREYLTFDELKLLAKTDCELPFLKNASIFSGLTGLRYSDIEKLTWQEIQGNEKDEYVIRFTQKKTQGVETQQISLDAVKLLGERKEPTIKVFPELIYSAWQNQKLQDWVYSAGIMRKITFHSFRHTYATTLLTLGTEIYTVSKMLGHKDIHTTQIYAKIIDQTKRVAANKMTLD